MSQFRRNPAIDAPAPELAGGLRFTNLTQGLAVQNPAIGSSSRAVLEIQRAFGLGAELAKDLKKIDLRRAAEQDALDEGLASRHALERQVRLEQDIAQRNVLVPEGEDVVAFANRIIEEDLADDTFSAAYKRRYADVLAPRLSRALSDQQQGLIDEARQANIQTARDLAVSARSPDDLVRARDAAMAQGLTEDEASRAVLIPALELAARSGDADAMERVRGVIGGRYREEQKRATAIFGATRAQASERANNALDERLSSMALDGASFEQRRAWARGQRGKGPSDERIMSAIERIDADERQAGRAAITMHDDAALSVEMDAIAAEAQAELAASDSFGRGLARITDREVTLPSGKTVRVPRQDQIEMGRDRAIAEIERRYDNPTDRIVATQAWSMSTGVEIPAFRHAMQNVATSIDPTLDASSLTEAQLGALEMFKTLSERNEAFAVAHAGPSADVLRTAAFLERTSPGMTPAQALFESARIASQAPDRVRPVAIPDKKLRSAVRDVVGDVGNPLEVAAVIGERARYYMVTAGAELDDALKQATKDVSADYARVDGEAVRIRGSKIAATLTTDRPRIDINGVARTFKDAVAEAEGGDAGDLRFRQIQGDTWGVFEGGVQVGGTLTSDDLIEIDAYRQAIDRAIKAESGRIARERGPALSGIVAPPSGYAPNWAVGLNPDRLDRSEVARPAGEVIPAPPPLTGTAATVASFLRTNAVSRLTPERPPANPVATQFRGILAP